MPYCPSCRSEYRDGFDTCASCNTLLVPELAPETLVGVEAIEAAVDDGTAVVVARGNLDAARRMRDALAARKVAAVVVGDPDACDHRGVCSTYEVLVAPDGVDPARAALAAEYQAMLVNEGLGAGADGEAVDLESGEYHCPACGTVFPAAPECPDCGLYLGVPGEG